MELTQDLILKAKKQLQTGTAPRLLITGGQGMLGHAFLVQAKKHFPQCEVKALGKDELCVTNQTQLSKHKDWVRGGWIIHSAALVNVEGCAREPEKARQIIVEGTRNTLDLAFSAEARFFYPQSFLIYDGKTNPIAEAEKPRPLSLYGELKAEAEALILNKIPNALIVRMGGFFGGEVRDKNFVGKIVIHLHELIKKGTHTINIGDRVWQPTLTDALALNSLLLMFNDKKGLYQMASHGCASFFELTEAIVEILGWQQQMKVISVSANEVSKNELGGRPAKAVLSCQRLQEEGYDIQQPWKQSLTLYLSQPYFDQFRKI